MKKRLMNYIAQTEKNLEGKWDSEMTKDLLINIEFFQHERIIHLIVTFLTALAVVLFLLGFLITENIFLFILFILSICLFAPYIMHYYRLENGVQYLYTLYDKTRQKK